MGIGPKAKGVQHFVYICTDWASKNKDVPSIKGNPFYALNYFFNLKKKVPRGCSASVVIK